MKTLFPIFVYDYSKMLIKKELQLKKSPNKRSNYLNFVNSIKN